MHSKVGQLQDWQQNWVHWMVNWYGAFVVPAQRKAHDTFMGRNEVAQGE